MLDEVMQAVRQFQAVLGHPSPPNPTLPEKTIRNLRRRLLEEEVQEYMDAEKVGDPAEIADAMADMIYIIVGTALTYGIPLSEVLREVHRSNMAKFPNGNVRYREDMKVLKPEGWEPPDIAGVLECAAEEPKSKTRGVFRKKPVEVNAAQWFKNGDHPEDGCEILDGLPTEGKVVRRFRHPRLSGMEKCKHCHGHMHDHGWIDTLEGGHIVCPGDFIITGVRGERYPCKADVFELTYDRVR